MRLSITIGSSSNNNLRGIGRFQNIYTQVHHRVDEDESRRMARPCILALYDSVGRSNS